MFNRALFEQEYNWARSKPPYDGKMPLSIVESIRYALASSGAHPLFLPLLAMALTVGVVGVCVTFGWLLKVMLNG